MADDTLKLEPRTATGSRAVRNLRREGKIPGILYGKGAEPVLFQTDAPTLRDAMGGERHPTLTVEVPGEGAVQAAVKDYQLDPVKGRMTHLDLLRV